MEPSKKIERGSNKAKELLYLRVPYFIDGDDLRIGERPTGPLSESSRHLYDRIFEGGVTLDGLLSGETALSRSSGQPTAEAVRATLSDEQSAIGLITLDLEKSYDIIIVEQGYGGVYVHTVELVKRLSRRWSVLLICPEDPLFEGSTGTDILTLKRLRVSYPELSYFSFVHIVRSVVRLTTSKLLLLTHRSQSLFLFDLVGRQPTVIYCDGFYDGGFAHANNFRLANTDSQKRDAIKELYYLLANGNPNFFGLHTSPCVNYHLLVAGCFALRDANANWCWGQAQTTNFKNSFPELAPKIAFVPPFTDPDLFDSKVVARDRRVLFTTTMHNIEKKGLPELLRAMRQIKDMRVRCVVRQPEFLPKIPNSLRARMEIGSVTKLEMVQLYHKVWLNCRVSREESSPVSILESMICEVPQITSTVVASQIPIIEHGKTGFVIDPDDDSGLVIALRTLLMDSKLRDDMGRACRDRAMEYSYDNRVGLFEGLLA